MIANRKFGIGVLLAAMLLVSMALVSGATAEAVTDEIASEVVLIEQNPELDLNPDITIKSYDTEIPYWYLLEADKDQQKTLLKYIDECYASKQEKNEMKKSMKDIWNRYPDSITEEDMIVLGQIDVATAEYLNDKYGVSDEVSVKWTATPHKKMTRIAVKKVGITDYYANIASNASDDPDTWPDPQIWQSYNHYYDPVTDTGLAAVNCDNRAGIARAYYNGGQLSAAYTELGYASHYLTDVGNPLHTGMVINQTLNQWVHYDYENYVTANWDVDYNFESVVSNNNYYYSISDPEDAAQDLAEYSNAYLNSLWMEIYYNPSTWESRATVISITESVLLKSAKYNIGLVKYMRS